MSENRYFLYGENSVFSPYDFKNKERCISDYMRYMLMRTNSMFEYTGLPETMPKDTLELFTQVNGICCIIEHEGKLYSLTGNWGGEPNQYYLPTQFVIANPYLNLNRVYDIGKDCVLYKNDSLYMGLTPMFRRYASLMVENDISMRAMDINSRVLAIVEARDDTTRASAEQFFNNIEQGKSSPISSNAFLESLRTQPMGRESHGTTLTDLIEFHQYLKASWFNELGLQANYNMKRESINSNEAQLNDDMLTPLIDDMLACRRGQVAEINDMYGTSITVELGSAWARNEVEWENEIGGEYEDGDDGTEDDNGSNA